MTKFLELKSAMTKLTTVILDKEPRDIQAVPDIALDSTAAVHKVNNSTVIQSVVSQTVENQKAVDSLHSVGNSDSVDKSASASVDKTVDLEVAGDLTVQKVGLDRAE